MYIENEFWSASVNHEISEQLSLLVSQSGYTPEDLQQAKSLLKAGADPNFVAKKKYSEESILESALDCRDHKQRLEMIQLLIEFGANIDRPGEDSESYPVEEASWEGDLELLKLLIRKGARKALDRALKNAIEKDAVEMVVFLIQEVGLDVTLFQPYQESYLIYCNEAYRLRDKEKNYDTLPGLETAKCLLSHGADVNGVEGQRVTPLGSAVSHDFIEMAELLIAKGASMYGIRETPMFMMVHSEEMAELLLRHGASFEERGFQQRTPLFSMVHEKKRKLIRYFIEHNADPYATDEFGHTPFHDAIEMEDLKFLEWLLQFYDIQKCHKMKSVLEVSEDPRILNFLKVKLGLIKSPIDDTMPISEERQSDPVFKSLVDRSEQLYQKLLAAEEDLQELLPLPVSAYNKQNMEFMVRQFEKNMELWKDEPGAPIQGIYFEFGGDAVDPFDAYGLFWGYEYCNDRLEFSKPVFAEKGDLNLSGFFSSIEEVNENFEPYYQDVKEYQTLLAYICVHLSFHLVTETEAFRQFVLKQPFYLIGAEHDQRRELVYCFNRLISEDR